MNALRVFVCVTMALMLCVERPAAAADGFFDGVLQLANLDGTNGFVVNGIDPYDYSGFSVSGAGDVNGDGIDDLLIGAISADPGGNSAAGESYVLFGSAVVGAGGSIDLSSLTGASGFVLNGIDPSDYSGLSVSGAGDVNGDSFDDILIGADHADPGGNDGAGESYVVFGSAGVGAGGSIELSSLTGANGFVLNGIDLGDTSGISVSGAGDVNSDGIDDLLIGADGADPGGDSSAGETYVVFGGAGVGTGGSIDLASLTGTNGFVINGIDPGDSSGTSVSGAGDVNGDGFDDLLIGADGGDPGGNANAGESYVVFGGAGVGAGGNIDLSSLSYPYGCIINGIDPSDHSGSSVSTAGDVNGDGIDDLLIGADDADPSGNSSAGESYVVFGNLNFGILGSKDLFGLDGTNGFVLKGIDAYDYSGRSVSTAGDVNDDGIDDLLIGADSAAPGGNTLAGESYIVFGQSGFTWTPATGGSFQAAGNWLGGKAPATTGGVIIIRPEFGGSIIGLNSMVVADRFTLGAELGTTSFILSGGTVIARDMATMEAGGRLLGTGTFATSGPLSNAGEIVLSSGLQLTAASIASTGLIHGVGRVDAPVVSSGRIEALDLAAELHFAQAVTNQTGGLIAVRDSALRLAGGLDNRGQVSVSDGASDLLGDIDNTGTIGLSSGASASLVGDLSQNGTANLLTGSRLIVFGEFSGSGGTTGGGTLEVLGQMSPGASSAAVHFGGDLFLGGGAETLIEIGGTALGEFDRLDIDGSTTLDGTLVVELLDSGSGVFIPETGDQFEIVSASGGLDGTSFDGVVLPALPGDLEWFVNYGANNVSLVATYGADFNEDGDVDGADFLAWQRGHGLASGANHGAGDADSNGAVNGADLAVWGDQFGNAPSPLAVGASNVAVPEPSTGIIVMLGMAALLIRRQGVSGMGIQEGSMH